MWIKNNGNLYKQYPTVQIFTLLGRTRNFESFCDHQNKNHPQQFLSSQSVFRVGSRKFRLKSVICVPAILICIMKEVHVHITQATHTFWNSGLCALDEISCYSNFWLSQFWLLTIVCLLMLLAWQALRQTKQFWQRNQVAVTASALTDITRIDPHFSLPLNWMLTWSFARAFVKPLTRLAKWPHATGWFIFDTQELNKCKRFGANTADLSLLCG